MAEYTYADVIIDPNDPRVEIGKEYYFANHVKSVLSFANIDVGYSFSTLSAIEAKSDYPFVDSLGNMNAFIIRKKEAKKKYVPFDLIKEEERERLRGAWVRRKGGHLEWPIVGISKKAQLVFLPDVVSVEAKELLEDYEFVDGTPCGKLREASK